MIGREDRPFETVASAMSPLRTAGLNQDNHAIIVRSGIYTRVTDGAIVSGDKFTVIAEGDVSFEIAVGEVVTDASLDILGYPDITFTTTAGRLTYQDSATGIIRVNNISNTSSVGIVLAAVNSNNNVDDYTDVKLYAAKIL